MHTYKICITFLSLVPIFGSISPVLAQNTWKTSAIEEIQLHQKETEDKCPMFCPRDGSSQTKEELPKGATENRGSGRFE